MPNSTFSNPIDLSGTIVTGGVSQLLIRANKNRTKFFIMNVDATNDLWFSPFGTTALPNAVGSVRIPANGGGLSFNGDAPGTNYYVYGAVTGQKFTAWADA